MPRSSAGEVPMIIDCHGHYTTAPNALEEWRNRQIEGICDPSKKPKLSDLKISDCPKPLGVCECGDCHHRRTDAGGAAGHRLGCRDVDGDLDLSYQPSPSGGARPTSGYRGLSQCPAPSRGHHVSGLIDLASRR